MALVLALAEAQSWQALSGGRLFQYIVFINWVILSFFALVERFQGFFSSLRQEFALAIGFVMLQSIVVLTTLISNFFQFGLLNKHASLTQGWSVYFTNVPLYLSYGILLGAFCLRYLYVREQWLHQQYAELNARIQAMQARIHPHFLFNSLNNVVSLIAIDPDKAESMLISLSRLFRASFQELKLVSLHEEIELSKQYLMIEQVRLGERLKVDWKIELSSVQLKQITIPLLTLQPLLENSIFHGVEPMMGKATIGVLVEILQNQVSIVITNPYTDDTINSRKGHGIALENVKQRLKAYYGNTVRFQVYKGEALYTTIMSYQYQTK
ncbi:alginate biosynthesis protein [Acinetobacter pittii]|nr:alginate biosynthesis protein [Acinetobacter pittii]OTL25302.1 alginate biosynthesis protein [Acinetobacter pittii]OTL34841.1 alginate biosynthesis protein [Acinetobacter pittii]OTM15597.1 alginate biosynthesis protein [Acinetobacter pittii]OTM21756.1 alginate biosynthesis protein [Acinetobacter pittii]